MTQNQALLAITQRIAKRSTDSRGAYLAHLQTLRDRPLGADRMGCANVAHAVAAAPTHDKLRVVAEKAPNLAIVTSYNDMLSAHAPYQHYPDLIKARARALGMTAMVAGATPAMCDGVTQGTPGMELSLFSRDAIAMSTAVALSHDMFDGALMLGVCDKIVPGLLIGALHFGHLPTVFVPAGPMASGLPNADKAKVREQFAEGKVNRDQMLEAESAAYHSVGTCTFYGTANSNQMLLEAMGLHVPGAAFAPPTGALRQALTLAAVDLLAQNTRLAQHRSLSGARAPLGVVVDERCIVNAMVALLATGGSTNHLIHWVAVARAAGILIDWNDFSDLSDIVPLLCRIYPNGSADVNQFEAAGGPGFVIGQLLKAGLMHDDVLAMHTEGIVAYARGPQLSESGLHWVDRTDSLDLDIARPASQPFSPTGGLKLLQGNLGRAVIKSSAVPVDRHSVEAPAMVFDSQEALLAAFAQGQLLAHCEQHGGLVCVVRWQGPRANGMPELHKLTPALAVLQNKGYYVALVTDGRMSGASGKVPAAIHVSPEAAMGGPLAKVRTGDVIRVDCTAGVLAVTSDTAFDIRQPDTLPEPLAQANTIGFGRGLFNSLRQHCLTAEEGACTW